MLEAGKEILQKLEDRANHLDRLKSLKDIENEIIRFYTNEKGVDILDAMDLVSQKDFVGDEELIKFLQRKNQFKALKLARGER